MVVVDISSLQSFGLVGWSAAAWCQMCIHLVNVANSLNSHNGYNHDYGHDDKRLNYHRHSRGVLHQLKCCPTVGQITHTDPRFYVSPRSTFSNCHVLFGYLCSFVHASLQ